MKGLFSATSRRRKPKLKLVCSFNGTFQPRPPSGKLRYTGGETRILSVDRYICFSRLKSKILELFPCPNNSSHSSFSLVYHLLDAQLVLITCDDDVLCMIHEYEKVELSGTHPRLWVFVCYDNSIGNVIDNKFCVDLGRNLKACLGSSDKNNNQVVHRSDDSLRKILLKQQFLAKKSVKPEGLSLPVSKSTDCRLGLEQTEVEDDNGKMVSDNLDEKLSLEEPESPRNETRNPVYVIDSQWMNILDGENFGRKGHFSMSHSHPLVPTNFNVRAESGIRLDSFSKQSHLLSGNGGRIVSGDCGQFGQAVQLMKSSGDRSMNMVGYMNRENIVPRCLESNTAQTDFAPLYSSSHFNGNVCPLKSLYSGIMGGIQSNWFGLGETRNPSACPYQLKTHRNNHTEMENPVNTRLDGRPWMGKLQQHGLQSSSNITKQGQLTKIYHPNSWQPSSDYAEVEGVESTTDDVLNKQTCLFNVPDGGQKNLAYDDPNFKESHLGFRIKADGCQIKVEADLMHQHELVSISGVQRCPGYGSGTGLRCDDKLLGIEEADSKSPIKCHNSAHNIEGGTSSSLALSLDSLSFSPFKEMDPPNPSLTAATDVAEALLKTQSKLFDMMDKEHFSSGPQAEKSSEATSISSFHKPEKDDEKTKLKQENESNLSIDEKSLKCSKINGGLPADVAAFYSHLASKELQTINNSDLEYIKELGSGTYGNVFYGKWKGSDVAIKKIKPSCFTEGAVDEDRLVADFWKEAHILGQLHHPNIVALYGVVTDGPVTNLATVTEYMVNGSLKQFFRRKDRTIDRRKRLIIAMDAAFGMEYLHGKNIVHFDLKSHNFLVNMRNPQRPVCKIGDLGLSKVMQKTLVSGGVRGTIPWMAPELLKTESMVTKKVDVYSFGIVMWELLTGEEPYAKTRSDDMIGGIIRGTLRPEIPSWCDPVWRSLMEKCWSSDPEVRPDFSEIAKELRAMAATMNIKYCSPRECY